MPRLLEPCYQRKAGGDFGPHRHVYDTAFRVGADRCVDTFDITAFRVDYSRLRRQVCALALRTGALALRANEAMVPRKAKRQPEGLA